uniref:Uncharacterized protein n=1 Tax=Setaria digitata TaxID=48799 RepID=A0A915Q6I7_9BILA
MRKEKGERNKKKKLASDGDRDLSVGGQESSAADQNQEAQGEIIEPEDKRNDNEIEGRAKLVSELGTNGSPFMLKSSCNDNDDKEYAEKKTPQEEASCPQTLDFTPTSSSTRDKENGPGKKESSRRSDWKTERNSSGNIEEKDPQENSSNPNYVEIGVDMEDIKTSEILANPAATEKDNSVSNASVSNVLESPVVCDMEVIKEISTVANMQCIQVHEIGIEENMGISKSHMLIHGNQDEKLTQKVGNLDEADEANIKIYDKIGRSPEQVDTINIQDSKTDASLDDTTKFKTDIQVDDNFAVCNQNADLQNKIFAERIKGHELLKIKDESGDMKGLGNEELQKSSGMMNVSECVPYITESLKLISEPSISDEAFRSLEDPGILNEVLRENSSYSDDSIQKLNPSEIPKRNSEWMDNSEKQDSINESSIVENFPTSQCEISCGLELLRDPEELTEIGQSKNKFYGAITSFWKHTAFSRKRAETTVPSEQPKNLSPEVTPIRSNQTLTFTEPSETLVPSSESAKSSEASTESTTKVTASLSHSNVSSSFLENTTTDRSSGYFPPDDNLPQNSLNCIANMDTDTPSEPLQVTISNSLNISDETIKDMDDSFGKMGSSRKDKKGKTESTNLLTFGYKVRDKFIPFPFLFFFFQQIYPSHNLHNFLKALQKDALLPKPISVANCICSIANSF